MGVQNYKNVNKLAISVIKIRISNENFARRNVPFNNIRYADKVVVTMKTLEDLE